ncbi:MAG: M23 family metallopeptidase, partial [Myxococcales bacterium]|nr:M23 family metallopeptidase [Myxococcales bacterium]
APAAAAPAAPEGQAAAPAAAATEWQVVHATVDHSIARTFSDALGDDGPAVSAEYARLFVWDVDMQRDLLKGDAIAVIWRKVGEDYQIAAATLTSGKKGELRAYRFQAPGDVHPSFWRADGTEVPFRLVDGPLESYEQVTSLLKDRPTHKGMDFKTPVGTPIHAPRAGRVDKTNWNWQFNGNSVELHLDDGVVAKFLHMSANHVKPGDHVTKGQVIGLTGNTGRSTAPHLHYQLERGDRILDPLEYHQTVRRKMPAAAMADFTREVQRLDGLFAAAPVKAEP